MAGVSKQIRLERWTTSGANNTESVEKFNMWADVKRNSGTRAQTNSQPQLVDSLTFRVRFRPDFNVTGNWRVVYDGNRHTVHSIEKEKENRFFWIIKAESKGTR